MVKPAVGAVFLPKPGLKRTEFDGWFLVRGFR